MNRNEEMTSRVRIFSADKLSAEAREKKWDRVKVVCTQPFNSRVKYGLSFLKLNEKDLEVGRWYSAPQLMRQWLWRQFYIERPHKDSISYYVYAGHARA